MTDTLRTWISAAHHAAFRCGGWAYVQDGAGGKVIGAAGGERNTTAARMAVAGLAAALREAPASGPALVVHTTSDELAAFAPLLADPQSKSIEPPTDNLDLWAQVLARLGGRGVRLVRVPALPKTPAAFADAWAELARDKAKATGPFTAAIPKPNLAKAGVGPG